MTRSTRGSGLCPGAARVFCWLVVICPDDVVAWLALRGVVVPAGGEWWVFVGFGGCWLRKFFSETLDTVTSVGQY